MSASLCACQSRHTTLEVAPVDARINLTQALAEVARTVSRPPSLDQSLQIIAEVAQDSVPGVDHASITLLHPSGRFETRASKNPLVLRLDHIQYAVDQGPCVDAVRGFSMVSAPRMRSERRWPSYAPQAAALGVQSQLSVKLALGGDDPLGSLNLYSTTAPLTLESEAMAELFGSHAATGPHDAPTPAPSPSPALESLRVIEHALGIVMNRFDIDANRAFDYLDESAARADLELADYAQQLLDEGHLH
jgi:hypothetical protein